MEVLGWGGRWGSWERERGSWSKDVRACVSPTPAISSCALLPVLMKCHLGFRVGDLFTHPRAPYGPHVSLMQDLNPDHWAPLMPLFPRNS